MRHVLSRLNVIEWIVGRSFDSDRRFQDELLFDELVEFSFPPPTAEVLISADGAGDAFAATECVVASAAPEVASSANATC